MSVNQRSVGFVETELTNQNQFTGNESGVTQAVTGEDGIVIKGGYNLSISGTFDATVTLQRSFDGGANFRDMETYDEPVESWDIEVELGVLYRAGIKGGDYTSGTALVRIGR